MCPQTGLSIHESWIQEGLELLPLPATLPEPFDTQVSLRPFIRHERRPKQPGVSFKSKPVLLSKMNPVLTNEPGSSKRDTRGTSCADRLSPTAIKDTD